MEYWPNTMMFFCTACTWTSSLYYSWSCWIIAQFNIDQLVGASLDELSSYIYWHSINLAAAFTVFQFGRCSIYYFLILSFVVTRVTGSLTLITFSRLRYWLETTTMIINPIKMIAEILNYAWKYNYPRNHSTLSYWEKEYPSRIDLGKKKNGGPFSGEEVENVKTVVRLILLLICVAGLTCADEVYWIIMLGSNPGNSSFKFCFISNNTMKFLTSVSLLLLYQFFIHPCFYKYIPSMLKKIGLGLTFVMEPHCPLWLYLSVIIGISYHLFITYCMVLHLH